MRRFTKMPTIVEDDYNLGIELGEDEMFRQEEALYELNKKVCDEIHRRKVNTEYIRFMLFGKIGYPAGCFDGCRMALLW